MLTHEAVTAYCRSVKCARADTRAPLGDLTGGEKRFESLLNLVRCSGRSCTEICWMDDMVQAGTVARRRAAHLASSPAEPDLLCSLLRTHEGGCDCLTKVLAWGTCVFFLYTHGGWYGPWTWVTWDAPRQVCAPLLDLGCPPWTEVDYHPGLGQLVLRHIAQPTRVMHMKPAWHRWHARFCKRQWLLVCFVSEILWRQWLLTRAHSVRRV
jgi:hypothetical protein